MKSIRLQIAFSLCLGLAPAAVFAANPSEGEWRQFRGPGGLATSSQTGLPVKWSADGDIVWRAKLPGAGTSSPILLGENIFLTCYSGFAQSTSDPGEMDNLMRHLVCLDRKSGKIAWKKDFKPQLPESPYRGNGARHGYSSSTPTTDGKRLYVFFGKSGVYCCDLNGEQIWHADVGSGIRNWGSAASPVLYKNLLIINASVESRRLLALDNTTGKLVWEAGGIRGAWNTPFLAKTPAGNEELVICIPRQILAFDPQTGKRLWECEGIPDRGYVCPTAVAHDGVVYVIGGRRNTAIAVKTGGRGDVTGSHRLWTAEAGSNVNSPVFHNGHLYWAHERNGIANCIDCKNGKLVYRQRMSPRPGLIYASVTQADGKLYYVSQHNGTYVLAAKPEFELLAHNKIESDDSRSNASVVPSRGQLLLRSDRFLYCIAQ